MEYNLDAYNQILGSLASQMHLNLSDVQASSLSPLMDTISQLSSHYPALHQQNSVSEALHNFQNSLPQIDSYTALSEGSLQCYMDYLQNVAQELQAMPYTYFLGTEQSMLSPVLKPAYPLNQSHHYTAHQNMVYGTKNTFQSAFADNSDLVFYAHSDGYVYRSYQGSETQTGFFSDNSYYSKGLGREIGYYKNDGTICYPNGNETGYQHGDDLRIYYKGEPTHFKAHNRREATALVLETLVN